MKYIKTTQPNGALEVFIFPLAIDHDRMALMLSIERGSGTWIKRTPVSAGFYNESRGCYGNSETLGLTSEMDIDTELVERQMRVVL